jgi:hypothetical protein
MVFTKPQDIIKDRNTSLEQKEKAGLQSLAHSLKSIGSKLENRNQQGNTIDVLKNQLTQDPFLSYKEQTLEKLKSEIDFNGLEQSASKRTPESVAMLQLFLFLNNAYQPGTNGEVSEKKIDGKWGKETAEALKTFTSQNPQFAQELISIQEEKNQIEALYITSVLDTVKRQIGKQYRR